MNEHEKQLKDLCVHLAVGKHATPKITEDYHARDLIVTPFDGNYGQAGVVIALNGSPPRGIFLVTKEAMEWPGGGYGVIWFNGSGRPRTLGEQQALTVLRFLRSREGKVIPDGYYTE